MGKSEKKGVEDFKEVIDFSTVFEFLGYLI